MLKSIIKVLIVITIIAVLNGLIEPVHGTAQQSKALAIAYCNKYCKGYTIKVVKENKVPKKRTGNHIIYIERLKTKACGGWFGRCKTGGRVKYLKKCKKGVTVNVYLVYNPTNNYIDDVISKACNGKRKGDNKYIKLDCEYCKGVINGCPYWYYKNDNYKIQYHMTRKEIEDFCESEKR